MYTKIYQKNKESEKRFSAHNKKICKKLFFKTVAVGLCFSALFSLSSCDSVKMYFAGGYTDTGISIDSVACGNVYKPTETECETVKSPYDTVFDNCLFVGNTVMCDFYKSVTVWRDESPDIFSGSTFFCGENFGVYANNNTSTELAESYHPIMEGEDGTKKRTVEDAVEITGANRVVFCMAGISDLPIYGDEENCHIKTANEMAKLIHALKETKKEISIVVISAPPISADSTQMKSLNNQKIAQLNEELSRVCTESGADFIDSFSLFCDENGALKREYCADRYCKLNEDGCKVLLASIRYYAKERKGEI